MKAILVQLKNWGANHVALLLPSLILGASIVINAVVMYFEDGICNDAVYYRGLIGNWIKYDDIMQIYVNNWNIFAMPPFWLWCVKNVSSWWGIDVFVAARIINFICGSLTPLVFYCIVRIFAPSRYFAFLGAIVLACHPVLSTLTALITRDCFYFFLISVAICFLLKGAMRDKLRSVAFAGIFLGFAILTRYESFELIPCGIIFIIFCVWDKDLSWRRALLGYLVFGIAVVATLAVCSWLMKLPREYHVAFWGHYLKRITYLF